MQVDIQGSGGRNYKIAVQRFAFDAETLPLRDGFHVALSQALAFSGVLDVVPHEAFLEPVETLDFDAPFIACENWSGIGADTFLRRTSVINYGEADFAAQVDHAAVLARAEGLEAHARSLLIRGKHSAEG